MLTYETASFFISADRSDLPEDMTHMIQDDGNWCLTGKI